MTSVNGYGSEFGQILPIANTDDAHCPSLSGFCPIQNVGLSLVEDMLLWFHLFPGGDVSSHPVQFTSLGFCPATNPLLHPALISNPIIILYIRDNI